LVVPADIKPNAKNIHLISNYTEIKAELSEKKLKIGDDDI